MDVCRWLTNFSLWLKNCLFSTSTSQFKFEIVPSQFNFEIVLNDEDLLTLILLRVPYRKLKSLKCVSKKWLHLITTPQFTRLHCNLLPPLRVSGLFIQRPPIIDFGRPCPDEVYFVSLDDPNTPSPYRTLTFAHDPFDPQRIRILRSCNGLLLCCTYYLARFEQRNTYVYNPSTNQLDTLPPAIRVNHFVGLAFDPSKSPHYKVIAFVTKSDFIGDFHIYSSETGTWRLAVQSFFRSPDMELDIGVFWHGCIHWLGDLNLESVPGSTLSDCLYFNVDECRLGTFPRPPFDMKWSSIRSYFGESEDHLHFIGVGPSVTSLSVYEMKSDYSEWFIKYWIDLAPISKVFPEMTESKARYHLGNNYAVAVLSLIRRENFQEDSFLVLEIPGKAIRYNLVDSSFKAIWDFAVDFGLENVHLWHCGRFTVSQYIEALSCV